MLSYNVAGLLREAPGTSRTFPIHAEIIPIADDVTLSEPIEGEIRLARTTRSILATGELRTAFEETCSRCLKVVSAPVSVTVQEEALPSIDLESGHPVDTSDEPDALRLDDHHELDMTEPIRAAISLAEPIVVLCRPDCLGLCTVCGLDRNTDPSHQHDDDDIDPRLAALAELRARLD
jgi:uncharacterized protein